jgi:hypothetical protein
LFKNSSTQITSAGGIDSLGIDSWTPKILALCARASGNGAEADSEGEGEEEEEREGKKKQRGKAPVAAAGSKLEPRQRRLLREHPLHVTIRIKTQVCEKKFMLL